MNPEPNAVPGVPPEERGAPGRMAATHPFLWSVRRELWEYKSIYIARLAVAGITLLGYLFASMGYALSSQDMARRRSALTEPLHFAMALIMGAAFIVGLFYCLDALHGERRDRSILFWKSLPVSDLVTVLAKATIPFVVLPLLAYVITLGVHFIMLLLSTAVLAGSGLNTATLWTEAWNSDVGLFYHLMTVHVLWYAPMYAWLLLVSGWAKRAAVLWSLAPAGDLRHRKDCFPYKTFCQFNAVPPDGAARVRHERDGESCGSFDDAFWNGDAFWTRDFSAHAGAVEWADSGCNFSVVGGAPAALSGTALRPPIASLPCGLAGGWAEAQRSRMDWRNFSRSSGSSSTTIFHARRRPIPESGYSRHRIRRTVCGTRPAAPAPARR